MGFKGLYRIYRNKWVKRFWLICLTKTASLRASVAKEETGAKKSGGRKNPVVRSATSVVFISQHSYTVHLPRKVLKQFMAYSIE